MKKDKMPRFKASHLTRDEIEKATKDFKKQGGRIQKIEPQWIEDFDAPGFLHKDR